MHNEQLPDHPVYAQPVIEFVTAVAEFCLTLENGSQLSKGEFITRMAKLSSLLYYKASVLAVPEPVFDDAPERFVTEGDYNFVMQQTASLLAADDSFLDVFHPDMSLSDTPIAVTISENIADVYQEVKDFAASYQLADTNIMNDALVACLTSFGEHWGQKLLGGLRAFHALRYSGNFDEEVDRQDEVKMMSNRDSFFGYRDDDSEQDNDLLNYFFG